MRFVLLANIILFKVFHVSAATFFEDDPDNILGGEHALDLFWLSEIDWSDNETDVIETADPATLIDDGFEFDATYFRELNTLTKVKKSNLKKEGNKICVRRSDLKSKLKRLFLAQYPSLCFNLREINILNWPEGINPTSRQWSHKEMDKIEEKMNDFVFLERGSQFSYDEELGLYRLGDLRNVSVPSWTGSSTNTRLLKRFREESGDHEAQYIKWSLLDRTEIPSKYEGIPINSNTMSTTKFYKNYEIVDNIHFRPAKVPKHK